MADEGGSWSAFESLLGDRYTREARLAPAFLSVFPIFLLLLLSFKGLQSVVPALLTLLCVFGVMRWISHIARRVGDAKEIRLFRKWGGKPTTTMLRYATRRTRAKDSNDHVQHLLGEAPRAHDISTPIANGGGPDLPAEHLDREAAKIIDPNQRADKLDSLYEPVVAWMRENSRQNALVFEEEISYGFQRNFFALKWFAVICNLVALAAQGAVILPAVMHKGWKEAWPYTTSTSALILTANVVYLLCVVCFVTKNSVKIQGFIYARQLLDSLYGAAKDKSGSAKPDATKKSSDEDDS